jgi:hypothetical protein
MIWMAQVACAQWPSTCQTEGPQKIPMFRVVLYKTKTATWTYLTVVQGNSCFFGYTYKNFTGISYINNAWPRASAPSRRRCAPQSASLVSSTACLTPRRLLACSSLPPVAPRHHARSRSGCAPPAPSRRTTYPAEPRAMLVVVVLARYRWC